jgi:phage shock protein PspC (stress-responsive transcriptional regulator)
MTQQTEPKRLYRSKDNKVVAGICGGIGEYFNADPVIVRVLAVALAFITGGAALGAYIILIFIIPERPSLSTAGHTSHKDKNSGSSPDSSGPILDRK